MYEIYKTGSSKLEGKCEEGHDYLKSELNIKLHIPWSLYDGFRSELQQQQRCFSFFLYLLYCYALLLFSHSMVSFFRFLSLPRSAVCQQCSSVCRNKNMPQHPARRAAAVTGEQVLGRYTGFSSISRPIQGSCGPTNMS